MPNEQKAPWFEKNLDYVMSYSATLREPEAIGPVPAGLRLNFYVTGGSVFPTGGYANPTLTIIALAIRLADHLKFQLKATDSLLKESLL